MARFGSFEVDREISSAQGAVVYLVREGSREGIVKLFSGAASATGDTTVWRRGDFAEPEPRGTYGSAAEFSGAAERQKQAGGDHVAPVLETGTDERGTWYRTAYYKTSLKRIIGLHLRPEVFHGIILGITRGALAFKSRTGVAHGNLKPSNVFVISEERGRKSRAVISDPMPARGGGGGAHHEVEDLRAIGEMIFQIVRRKQISARENYPLPADREWTAWFGKKGEAWRELCNRLLKPDLGPGEYTLEDLERDLLALKSSGGIPRPVLAAAAVVVAAGAIAGGIVIYKSITRPKGFATLKIKTQPEDAQVFFDGENTANRRTPFEDHELAPGASFKIELIHDDEDYETFKTNVNLTATHIRRPLILDVRLPRKTRHVMLKSSLPDVACYADGKWIGNASAEGERSLVPLEVGLPALIEARHTNSQSLLPPITNSLVVQLKTTNTVEFDFPRGTVAFSSQPAGARVLVKGRDLGPTPLTNDYFSPGTDLVTLTHPTHNPETFSVAVEAGRITSLPVRRLSQGEGVIALQVQPAGTQFGVVSDDGRTGVTSSDGTLTLRVLAGPRHLTLQHPSLSSHSFQVDVRQGATNSSETKVPHARLYVQSNEEGEVQRGGKPVGKTGTLLLVDPGKANYLVKKENRTAAFEWDAPNGGEKRESVVLTEGYGGIQFVCNLPEAIIQGPHGSNAVPASHSVSLTNIRATSHDFIATYPGLAPITRRVNVIKETNITERIDFAFGGLKITVPPDVVLANTNWTRRESNYVLYAVLPPGPTEVIWGNSDFWMGGVIPANITDKLTTSVNVMSLLRPAEGTVHLEVPEGSSPAQVALDGKPLDRTPPFSTNLAARPQPYEFTVSAGRRFRHSEKVLVKRGSSAKLSFPVPSEPTPYTNYLNMEFEWISEVPIDGTNRYGCWVARYEVTREQMRSILDKYDNTVINRRSAFGTNWPARAPADAVTPELAEAFCRELTRKDTNAIGKGLRYEVPTFEQFVSYCHPSAANVSVYGGQAPKHIGSMGKDEYQLYDVNGNLRELVKYAGAIRPVGTAYCGRLVQSTAADLERSFGDSLTCQETGLRVILVPGPPLVAKAP